MSDEEFLQQAINYAAASVADNGGPFGAIVVKDGKVIGRGSNRVTANHDPTAHAEVAAIRDACKTLHDFSLAGATLYASCEPCPMCLAAIYWARLDRVVYAATREQAADAGFDDGVIEQQMTLPPEERSLKMERLELDAGLPFVRWQEHEKKTRY